MAPNRAALTIDDLSFALVRWVVDIYHNTRHTGLGRETPAECWERLIEKEGVRVEPDRRASLLAGSHSGLAYLIE